MLGSKIETRNGVPSLFINGEPTAAMAYTTYFNERSCHGDFLDAGYRIFFVNVAFTRSPINSLTGFTPFRIGVFDNPEKPDYSEFEGAVRRILEACPEAIIFPRIYISMPKWWIESHPDEVVMTDKGGIREALFSDAFRRDGSDLLRQLVCHIKDADYADRIGGWQICGGMTQEWFHHDYRGSLGKAAIKPYGEWVKKTYGEEGVLPPKYEDFLYKGAGYNECENARRYSLFSNIGVAQTIDCFAGVIKTEVEYKQVVGVFYGYSFESNKCVIFGTHALRRLIDSENLDFFSSPNAYTQDRAFGIDWSDMIPVDSVSAHGKLCFIECDIRTYLTVGIQEVRPGEYPDDLYRTGNGTSVWSGPPTPELSREALRKCFAHQITKASAIWWFDMWGGWYKDEILMKELVYMKGIYEKGLHRGADTLSPEVVMFADERAYSNLLCESPQLEGVYTTRTAMGNTGVPYDCCMVEDADTVLRKYRAAVFAMPIPSEAGKRAMALCDNLGIPHISASEELCGLDTDEIREFFNESGVHQYSDEKDVLYLGCGYIGLHSTTAGVKRIRLPRAYTVSVVYGTKMPTLSTNLIEFELSENGTALFSIS